MMRTPRHLTEKPPKKQWKIANKGKGGSERRLRGQRALPLWEKVKDIFKKYGVTVTAVMLAAGTVIGAVIGTTTISLKSSAKRLGNGLNEIGKKNPPARPHRLESKLYLPSRWAGDQLLGHTHMAVDPGRGALLDEIIVKKGADNA